MSHQSSSFYFTQILKVASISTNEIYSKNISKSYSKNILSIKKEMENNIIYDHFFLRTNLGKEK